METCSVAITSEAEDEILWCDLLIFYKLKFGFVLNFDIWHSLELMG